MPSIDVRGHLVPNGSEPASRQALLDFSQSVPSVKACESETAAIQHINALKAAGVKISESNPVFVWRTDIKALLVWDGLHWAGTSRFRIETQQVGDVGISYKQPGPHELSIFKAGRIAGFTDSLNYGSGWFPYQHFPDPFPNACIAVVFQPIWNNAVKWNFTSMTPPAVYDLDRTGFRVMFPNENDRSRAHALMWIAVGF
jgi:hypothetical protein